MKFPRTKVAGIKNSSVEFQGQVKSVGWLANKNAFEITSTSYCMTRTLFLLISEPFYAGMKDLYCLSSHKFQLHKPVFPAIVIMLTLNDGNSS